MTNRCRGIDADLCILDAGSLNKYAKVNYNRTISVFEFDLCFELILFQIRLLILTTEAISNKINLVYLEEYSPMEGT